LLASYLCGLQTKAPVARLIFLKQKNKAEQNKRAINQRVNGM
jgi:hypothetical protein